MKAVTHVLPISAFNGLDVKCLSYNGQAEDNDAKKDQVHPPQYVLFNIQPRNRIYSINK
jgi:hypothetical protein